MKPAAVLFAGLLKIVYAPLKLLPTQNNKILFLSRQSDSLPLDFDLLMQELTARCPGAKSIFIGKRVQGGIKAKILFSLALGRSLYHLATSKVCVLDSYWPAVSVLKHKDSLTVIQMWHAMGKIKRSGKQTLGMSGGRDAETARALCMHEGYDYVIAGAPAWNEPCCLSFGIEQAQIVNIGLPRGDMLAVRKNEMAAPIYKKYPEFNNKKVVLYAPTFRKNSDLRYRELLKKFDYERYELVIKSHPNQKLEIPTAQAHDCPEFSAFELLSIADYLITDYSAIAVEAAIGNVKTLYYLYDYDDYMKSNGLNIDLFAEMKGCVFRDADTLLASLKGEYPHEVFEKYKKRYVLPNLGHATEDAADLIFEKGLLCSN